MVAKVTHIFAASCSLMLLSNLTITPSKAQTVNRVQLPLNNSPSLPQLPPPQDVQPPSPRTPTPPSPPPQLPPPSELFQPNQLVPIPDEPLPETSQIFTVKQFEVIAARSQFSLGIGAFNATINENEPDSRFFAWRGQAQWVRLLAPETLLLIRGDVQLASTTLLASEQFGLGGINSVRGYRQDLLLADNGALASVELRLQIMRLPQWDGVMQVTPFFDLGTAWNNSSSRDKNNTNTLASVGLGLR